MNHHGIKNLMPLVENPEQADDLWNEIVAFVAEWITTYGPYDDDGEMAREWREEMGGDPS